MPEDAVLGVRAPLTGYASLKQNILHDFQFILYEAVGGKLRKFYHTATLQQANFISDYLRVTSMNSSFYQQSELSVILEAHNLNSKVPKRERFEEKLMPSVLKDRFLSLNSHIFFFVVDQC